MSKLTLNDITAGHGSQDLLNDNFTSIKTAVENTLSRDGTSPNQMQADLDMNGFSILNLGSTADPLEWRWRGVWTTATAYIEGDVVYVQLADDATNGGRTYRANTDHTSGTFATDLASGYWQIVAQRGADGATGAGSGDLLAANNLSDLANLTTAMNNLLTAHGPLETADIADDSITVAKIADGTDGELLTWDSAGEATTIPVGTSGQVLTSNGAGAEPTWEDSSVSAASQAQMEAATSTTTYVSPGRMQHHPGMAKAWVKFTGTTINASYNVASVGFASGEAIITFTTPMSGSEYAVMVSYDDDARTAGNFKPTVTNTTTTVARVSLYDDAGFSYVTSAWNGHVVVFGDQ